MTADDFEIIRAALVAANEDVYGDGGNVEAFAALDRLEEADNERRQSAIEARSRS